MTKSNLTLSSISVQNIMLLHSINAKRDELINLLHNCVENDASIGFINSLLKPLAAKAATIEGTNPSLAIVDEYHLHPDNAVYSALELGMGARPEGILFAITTAGSNVISACKQHYDYCCQILDGEEQNESLFALIYELDDENEIDDEALWIKANPNLDVSVDSAALHDTIQKARGIPSQWTEMLTKRFNIWCQGETPWMGDGAWKACQTDYDENDLKGLECYAGLDLSSTGDITSLCYTFPVDNELLLLTRHYLPEAQLQNPANKNRAIYRQWVQAGWIRTTTGDCIDYDRIRDDILKDSQRFDIKLVGFDTWNAHTYVPNYRAQGWMLSRSRKPICVLAPWRNLLRCSLTVKSFVTTAIRYSRGRCLTW